MRLFLLIVLSLVFATANAQDTLFMRNGDKIRSMVLEIGEKTIKYKDGDNLKGPDYIISGAKVNYIKHGNGRIEKIKRLQVPLAQRKKLISFSSDLLQSVKDEYNLSIEYALNPHFCLGTNLGKIRYNPNFSVFILSPNQGEFPGTVYNGYSLRLYLKMFRKKTSGSYWNVAFLYKSMSYRNVGFFDMYQGEHWYASYTRSEDAFALGFSILKGHEYSICGIGHIDVFWGLGFRYRERNITTLTNETKGSYIKAPVGVTVLHQYFPVPEYGLRIGINIPKKTYSEDIE